MEGPIFIVGGSGSGTTLLRCMLGRHERIAIPAPTGFMRAAAAQAFIPFWPYGERWQRRLGIGEAELDARLGEFYGGLFRAHAEREGAARWGDATPWHLWHLERMAALFPDARFVGVVRHPRASVASAIARLGRTPPVALRRYERDTAELLRGAAALGDRCALVRYEDLVRDPERVLRALLGWLGEPWCARVLEVTPDAGRMVHWPGTAAIELPERAVRLARLLGYEPDGFEPPPRDLWRGSELAGSAPEPGAAPPLAERPYDPRRVALRPVEPATVRLPPPAPRRRAGARLRRRARAALRRAGRGPAASG